MAVCNKNQMGVVLYYYIRGSETKWCLSGEQINIISCFRVVEWPCLYHLSFQSRLLHVHVPRFKWSVYGHGYMVFGPLSATGVDHPLMILAHYTLHSSSGYSWRQWMTRPLPTSIKLQLNLCVVIRWINIIHISSLPAKVSSPVLSMPLIHWQTESETTNC